MTSGATLPLPLRALNRVGRVVTLPRATPDAERIAERARRAAGAGDAAPLDPPLREALEALVGAARQAPRITPFGRLFFSLTVEARVANRLRIDAALRSTALAPVEAPIFVVALPRTGTTLLHRLLDRDPRLRTLRTWEMDHPVPPPDPATFARDPRIARARRDAALLDWVAPDFKSIHEIGAELPEECINLFANELESVWFLVGLDLPSYARWLDARDLRPLYARHRLALGLLASRFPLRRWVLKAPMHLLGLSAILATYPDARIVWTHRDPARVVPSEASLFVTMRRAFQDGVDPHAVGRELLEQLADWWARASAARRAADPSRFFDVPYDDLVREPMDVIERLYAWSGMELEPSVRAAMEAHVRVHRQHRHGVHRYAAADFGLREEEIRERFPRVV